MVPTTREVKNKLKNNKTIMKKYIKLEFPEYQKWEELEDFEEHSYFCAEAFVYFVEEKYYYQHS